MKQKAIIHIGASELQIESIKSAKALDLYVILTDMNVNALGITYGDEFHCIAGDDEEKLLSLAQLKNKQFDIIGVYGNSDFALLSIAKIHKELNIKGAEYNAVLLALDKYKSKERWIKDNITTPYAFAINSVDEIETTTISYPTIIKPKDSCGSQGIKSATNYEELIQAVREAFQYSDTVLIENYIKGKHYDTIGILWDTKFIPMGIGNRYFAPDPYHFPIWGHSPSDLSEGEIQLAYDLTSKAGLSLGLNNTPIKADLIFDGDTFYIIEITPRFHGDVFTAKMIPFSCNEQPIKNLFHLYKYNQLYSNIQCKKKIIWKAIFPKKELKGLAWINSSIEYKDIFFNHKKKIIFNHKDNTSLVGFIWFEVDNNSSFIEYYKYIEQKLGDYIL